METPSEWAKRFNQQKAHDEADLPKPETAAADSSASVAEFPSEPFQCPACGQLLAPACRVCVACKHIIDPAEIGRTLEVVSPAASAPSAEPRPQRVPYPWRIFFAVLGIALLLGLLYSTAISFGLLKENQAELGLRSAPIFAGGWVFFDALRRRIPRPLRWAVGTMLLLIVVFPWYLARRKAPQATVPFIEAEVGPVTRILLIAVLLFFLISLIFYIVQGPQPGSSPTPPLKFEKSGNGSHARMTYFRPWREAGDGRTSDASSNPRRGIRGAQAEISAPSDAWQT
jgi:hypothetical protein